MPAEEISRGEAAARIINDPLFQDAKAKVLASLEAGRREVPMHATAMHTRLIEAEQIAHKFFQSFEYAIQTGKMAQAKWAQDEHQRTLRERAVAMFGKMGRNAL